MLFFKIRGNCRIVNLLIEEYQHEPKNRLLISLSSKLKKKYRKTKLRICHITSHTRETGVPELDLITHIMSKRKKRRRVCSKMKVDL